jgi:type IV secretory pathway VirB2 component (pilin)
MRDVARLIAFILLVIGTVGLLVNEFAIDWGRVATLIFAVFNCIGLVTLALTFLSKKGAR